MIRRMLFGFSPFWVSVRSDSALVESGLPEETSGKGDEGDPQARSAGPIRGAHHGSPQPSQYHDGSNRRSCGKIINLDNQVHVCEPA